MEPSWDEPFSGGEPGKQAGKFSLHGLNRWAILGHNFRMFLGNKHVWRWAPFAGVALWLAEMRLRDAASGLWKWLL